MDEDELATIEDCIRCAYVECLIDEDGERRLLAELARLRAVEAEARAVAAVDFGEWNFRLWELHEALGD